MTNYKNRLQVEYETKLIDQLAKDLAVSNKLEVPKLSKIVVSMTTKDAVLDSKAIEKAADVIMRVTGQKPIITKAKKAIAGFKLKAGVPIGCKVTLRKGMMYDFLDRLIMIALPRVRDFRGLNHRSFDGNGNFSMGLKEHTIFPEINVDTIEKIMGMNIVITTNAKSDEHALALLKAFNLPFMN